MYAKEKGKLHSPEGIDYFVYAKGTLKYIKPFIIGRPTWDNWLLWFADKKNIPIIELTYSVFIIHQNHDYSHIDE